MNFGAQLRTLELIDLANISVLLAEELKEAGISSRRELAAIGAEESWQRVRANGRHHDVHVLLALEGAITGVSWRELPEPRRLELLRYAMRMAA